MVPTSVTDHVPCRSFLLLSVLQIVDSQPSWILLSVLGELRSTSRIADILPVLVRQVTWLKYPPLCLSAIPGVEVFSVVEKFFLLVRLSPCFYPRLSLVSVRFAFYFYPIGCKGFSSQSLKKVCAWVLTCSVLFRLIMLHLCHCRCLVLKTWSGRCSQGNRWVYLPVRGLMHRSGIPGTWRGSTHHETCPAACMPCLTRTLTALAESGVF